MYNTQIFRTDAKNAFVEILNTAFPINKVLLNFCTYDGKTNTQTCKLEIYMDIEEMLYFCNLITSGRLDKRISDAQKTGKYEGKDINDYTEYFLSQGGTVIDNKERLKKEQKKAPVPEGCKAIAKKLKILKSTKYKYMLKAEYYKGHKDDKGLIVAEGNPFSYILIPLTEQKSMEMALTVNMHLQAYYNQFYQKFNGTLFPNQECKVYVPDKEEAPSNAANKQKEKGTDSSSSSPTPSEEKKTTDNNIVCIPVKNTIPLTIMRNKKDFCMKAIKSDGKEVAVIFRQEKIKTVKPNVWEEFKKKTDAGSYLFKLTYSSIIDGEGMERLTYVSGL